MKLTVRVQPGARRSALVGRMANGTLKLAVTAPPEGGRANQAVVELLAETLGLGRRQVQVVGGASSRSKVVSVEGMTPEEVERKLDQSLAGGEKRGNDGE
jgi:uncharacterized protein (TIGR00251 family)